MSRLSLQQAATAGILVAAGFLGWACSGTTSDDLLDIQQDLQTTKQELDGVRTALGQLAEDFQTLNNTVEGYDAFLRTGGGGGLTQEQSAQLNTMSAKLTALEGQLTQARTEIQTLKGEQAALKAQIGRGGASQASAGAAQPTTPRETTTARPTRATGQTSRPAPAPEEKPVGYYYVVQPGETFEKIAEANRMSAGELRSVNNVNDPNLQPAASQPIWIPRQMPSR